MNWTNLTTTNQISELKELSFDKTVVIFKHSTSCYISSMVLKQFEKGFDCEQVEGKSAFYFLDLIKYRPVSNLIVSEFGIRHESPQVLVIKNGEVTHHNSHSSIQSSQIQPMLV